MLFSRLLAFSVSVFYCVYCMFSLCNAFLLCLHGPRCLIQINVYVHMIAAVAIAASTWSQQVRIEGRNCCVLGVQ